MNSSARPIPVTAGRNSAGVGSNGKSRISSLLSSYHASCGLGSMRGNFSCRSHFGDSSTYGCGYGIRRGNFSSISCGSVFIGGGFGRRMSAGSCPSGNGGLFPLFAYGDGPVEVGNGVVGGMGGGPVTYGTIFSSTDGKTVMKNLNDRLASYIDKVQLLEAENAALESNISGFYAKQGPAGEPKDYSHYCHQIEELKNQIICATAENNKILLKIDNDCMDLEDVRQKSEVERGIRENMEADLSGLRPILDELSSCKADLETELESLQGERCDLQKIHEKELTCLKKQSGDVNMEVSTCPGPDLKKILEEMRRKYEAMIDTNRKEVAQWYEGKLEEVNQEVCTSSQEVEDGNHKVINLKRQLQAFEIDLQAQCNLRDALQVSLAEAECRCHAQLAEIQDQISCMEQQLAELRLETEGQDEEYKELLDVKNRLEQEIQTYRSLLEEGQLDHVREEGSSHPSSAGRTGGISHSTQRQPHHH